MTTILKNYKWKVDPEPTGRFRGFENRRWPSAFYMNERENLCGDIQCSDDYSPSRAKSGLHTPLTVRVCDHSVTPYKWRKLKGEFATLDQAKMALEKVMQTYPALMPAEFQKSSAPAQPSENEHVERPRPR